MNVTASSTDGPVRAGVSRLPAVILFDVNETLSDMSPMAERFVEVGASAQLAATWFAALLRDGFALTATGRSAPFAQIGIGSLCTSLGRLPLNRSVDDAIKHIMGGFNQLSVHDDVRGGIPALSALDTRLVTLSNGATTVAHGLLERAQISQHFERLLSVEDAGVWKSPDRRTLCEEVAALDVIVGGVVRNPRPMTIPASVRRNLLVVATLELFWTFVQGLEG